MRLRRVAWGAGGILVALVAWQAFATWGPFGGSTLPTATESFAAAVEMLGLAETWSAIGQTLAIALIGLLIALVLGVVIGLLIATSETIMYATRFIIEFLRPIPPIVILPVAVLVLGPTGQMSVFLILFGLSLGIAVQTAAGVENVDPLALDTARSYGMSRLETMGRVILPSALPYIGTAFRIAAPAALLIAVVAGLLGGGPGLGFSLVQAQLAADRPRLFGYVIILGVLGLAIQLLTEQGERRLLRWHPQFRSEAP